MKIELDPTEIRQACREYIARRYGIGLDRIPDDAAWRGDSRDARRPLTIVFDIPATSEGPYRTSANPEDPKT